jgi:hypothetical protein
VSFVDLTGDYSARRAELRHPFGPVANMKYGKHDNHTRLSFNYLDDYAPSATTTELLCMPGFMAVKVTLRDSTWREEESKEDEATEPELSEAPDLFAPDMTETVQTSKQELLQEATSAGKTEESVPNDDQKTDNGESADNALLGPDFNLRNYETCLGTGEGSGKIETIATSMDPNGRLVVVIPIDGNFGEISRTNSLNDQVNPNTKILFKGNFETTPFEKVINDGPVSHIQLTSKPTQSEFPVFYKANSNLKAVNTEIFCKNKAAALRLSFE